jgi:hypothetical protein
MNRNILIGYILTFCISAYGGWQAADLRASERFYNVESKIKLIEIQKADIKDISDIKQSLIRIEGKLDLKEDKYQNQDEKNNH